MSTIPEAPPHSSRPAGSEHHERSGWTIFGLVVLVLAVGSLLAYPVVRGVDRGYRFLHGLDHPTAFSDLGYGGGGTVRVGTTFTFPLNPDPWDSDHGTLHVHWIAPLHAGALPKGATLSVWRCSRSDVGSPGGWAMGEGPIARHCTNAQRVTGPFDYDASRGSREALLLAVSSPTPGKVDLAGAVVDYREGLQSGLETISIEGQVTFIRR